MKKTSFSFPLHEYVTTQINNLKALIGKEPVNDTALKGRIAELTEIRDKFQPEHYKTKHPDTIGIGTIVDYTFQGKKWRVVIDKTSLCINGKAIAIKETTPLAKALIGQKSGQTVLFNTGGQQRQATINTVTPYDAKTILAIITAAEKTTNTTAEPVKKEKEALFTT